MYRSSKRDGRCGVLPTQRKSTNQPRLQPTTREKKNPPGQDRNRRDILFKGGQRALFLPVSPTRWLPSPRSRSWVSGAVGTGACGCAHFAKCDIDSPWTEFCVLSERRGNWDGCGAAQSQTRMLYRLSAWGRGGFGRCLGLCGLGFWCIGQDYHPTTHSAIYTLVAYDPHRGSATEVTVPHEHIVAMWNHGT